MYKYNIVYIVYNFRSSTKTHKECMDMSRLFFSSVSCRLSNCDWALGA